MTHKSFAQLDTMIYDAGKLVTTGVFYAHYKDPSSRYLVTGLSILEATDEVAVKYTSSLRPDIEFIRPLSNWLENVKVDGKEVPRFRRLRS